MTKLEFINKEIKQQKITIKVNTSLLSRFDKDDDVANNVLLTKIMIAENRLKTLKQIKADLEILDILLKCVRVGTIQYDENDYSTSCEEFCFEFDSLSNEELLKLNKYLSSFLTIGVDLSEKGELEVK